MIDGKYIVVVGSNGLIGQSIVKELVLNQNCRVLAVDIVQPTKIFKEIIDCVNFEFKKCDTTKESEVYNLMEKLSLEKHCVDCVINTSYPRNNRYGKKFFDVKINDFNENLSMNLGSCFLIIQQFSKLFMKLGKGNIINISSIYGHIAPKFDIYENQNFTMPVEYAVIKSGLNHLNRYAAKLLGGNDIRFNIVSPGGIENGHSDKFKDSYRNYCLNKGMLNPNDLLGSIIFLISDASQFINGQTIIVDDGFTL